MKLFPTVAALAASVVLCAAFRLPYWGGPYSGDECAYMTVAGELVHGQMPYTTAWLNRGPATFFFYALAYILPLSPDHRLDVFGLVFASLTAWGVFNLLYRAVGGHWASAGLLLYAGLCADPCMHGQAANNEFILNALIVNALVVFHLAGTDRRPAWVFLAGLLIGVAAMVKEHSLSIFFVMAADLLAARGYAALPRLGLLLGGTILPVAAVIAVYGIAGRFEDYRQVFLLHLHYSFLSYKDLPAGPLLLANPNYQCFGTWPLWLLGLLWLGHFPWHTGLALSSRLYLLASSVMIVLPGVGNPYYYYLALPPLVLCGTLYLSDLQQRQGVATWLVRAVAIASLLFLVGLQVLFVSVRAPTRVSDAGPISELDFYYRDLGRVLQRESRPEERLFVYGCTPNLYYYSGLRPAQPDIWFWSYGKAAGAETPRSWLASRALTAIRERPPDTVVVTFPMGQTTFDLYLADLLSREYERQPLSVLWTIPKTSDIPEPVLYRRNPTLLSKD